MSTLCGEFAQLAIYHDEYRRTSKDPVIEMGDGECYVEFDSDDISYSTPMVFTVVLGFLALQNTYPDILRITTEGV